MVTEVFRVPGVSCEHCRHAITRSVSRLQGVRQVDVDLDGKTVAVLYDAGRTDRQAIRAAIEEAGYDVAD